MLRHVKKHTKKAGKLIYETVFVYVISDNVFFKEFFDKLRICMLYMRALKCHMQENFSVTVSLERGA